MTNTLSSAEAVLRYRRKPRENKMYGSRIEVAVLGMCNDNNGSDSRRRICAAMHIVGLSWEFLRIQTSVSQDWNYKILKID